MNVKNSHSFEVISLFCGSRGSSSCVGLTGGFVNSFNDAGVATALLNC